MGGWAVRSRRATVLFAVLLIVAIAIVIGTSVALATDARRTSMSGTLLRMQTRAMAWSGVQGALAELADQRVELVGGGDPTPIDSWEVTVDGRRLIVRLVPIGGEGVFAVSEAAKLNINVATPEMLAAIETLGDSGAAEIEALRGDAGIGSIEQVAAVQKTRPPASAGAGVFVAEPNEQSASSSLIGDSGGEQDLRSLLTTFSADPNLQIGLGERGGEFAGYTRINLNQEWSDTLGDAVRRRFDDDVARFLEGAMRSGLKLEDDNAIVRELNKGRVPPEDWAQFIDAFTVSPDPYQIGRVDINRAPAAVLACLPGFDAEIAAAIVETRGRIGADSLRNPAWPVLEGVMDAAAFEAACGWVTARSLQWRVRVEAGFAAAAENDRDGTGPLEHMTVLEAVLDLSENRPRVAYLRDVTYLPVLQRVAVSAVTEAAPGALDPGVDSGAAFVDANRLEGDPATTAGRFPASEEGARPGSGRSPSARMDFGDLDLGGPAPDTEPAPSGGDAPREGRDRRIGRWTSGGRR